MRASVDRRALLAAAKAVRPAAGGSVSATHGMRVEALSSGVRVACTNVEMAFDATVPVEATGDVDEKFVAVPPASRFTDYLAALDTDLVHLEAEGDDLTISGGAASATMRCYPEADWPQIGTVKGKAAKLTAEDLDLVRRVAVAASRDATLPALQVVRFEGNRVMATDNYRFARAEISVEVTPVSVPVALAVDVTKSIPDGGAKFFASDRLVRFETPTRSWTSTVLASETYPSKGMESLIEAAGERRLVIATEALQSALRRASVVDAGLHMVRIALDPDAGVVSIRNATADVGETAEEIPASGDFLEELMFNRAFLADAIELHQGDEVVFQLGDTALKPVLIDDGSVVQMLQPVKAGVKK